MPSLKRVYAALENRFLDLACSGKLLTRKTRPVTGQAHATVPTDWYLLKRIFKALEFDENDTILDVGCGTGRALVFLDRRYPKSRVIGIELNDEVASMARSAVSARCTVISGDVLLHCPPYANVFYLFNPFDENLMVQFCKDVLNKRDRYTMIYAVPSFLAAIRKNCTGDVSIKEATIENALRGLKRNFAVIRKF